MFVSFVIKHRLQEQPCAKTSTETKVFTRGVNLLTRLPISTFSLTTIIKEPFNLIKLIKYYINVIHENDEIKSLITK